MKLKRELEMLLDAACVVTLYDVEASKEGGSLTLSPKRKHI